MQVEKRLDLVKQVTHSTHKKLTACLQGQQGADTEKRSVKSPSVSTRIHHSFRTRFAAHVSIHCKIVYSPVISIIMLITVLSEETTTHNPGTVYG